MKSTTYHVARWSELFENNRSRKVKELAWVPIPNNHDGEKYSRLMQRRDAAQIYAAWVLILQVASKCHPRGSLVRDDGTPLDSDALSTKTRAPRPWFDTALPVLADLKWITSEVNEQQELSLDCHRDAITVPSGCHHGDEERKKEGNGKKEGKKEPLGVASPLPGKRNALFDAIAEATGYNPDEITPSLGSEIGKALAEIKAATPNVTPDEIRGRAKQYHKLHPDWSLTPSALAKHWASLRAFVPSSGVATPSGPAPVPEPACDWRKAAREDERTKPMANDAWATIPRGYQLMIQHKLCSIP